MSSEKCNLCGMMVHNMEVHMKLNHKKKKSNKPAGFTFKGFSPSTPAPAPLPSITKYQNTQYAPETVHNIAMLKTDKIDSAKKSQHSTSIDDNKVSQSVRNEECLQKSLAMLGNLMDQETARKIYKLDDVSESDLKDIFKSGSITKEGFELKLKRLLMIRIGNKYKKKNDPRYVKSCPDCGEVFNWDRGRQRGKNLEYIDHIKTCGIESNYSNEREKYKTQKQSPMTIAETEHIKQLEPEINMCVKEEIEIKKEELNNDYNPDIIIKTELDYEKIKNTEGKDIAVKNEPGVNNDIDLEANYGEQLMLKKLKVKREPVDDLEQVPLKRAKSTEELTEVKLEEELENNYETLSLELTLVKAEVTIDDQLDSDMLNPMNMNVLDKLAKAVVKDDSTLNTVVQSADMETPISEKNNDTQSQTENLGDAWFKQFSEMERQSTSEQSCVKKINYTKKGRQNKQNVKKVTNKLFKPRKQ